MIVILWKTYKDATDNIKANLLNILKDMLSNFNESDDEDGMLSLFLMRSFAIETKTNTLRSFFEILKEHFNQMNFANEDFIKYALLCISHRCGSIEIYENIVKIVGKNYFKEY